MLYSIYLCNLPVMLEALASEQGLWSIGEVSVEGEEFVDSLHSFRLQVNKMKMMVGLHLSDCHWADW